MTVRNPVKDDNDITQIFEEALSGRSKERYVLVLYVTGMTRRSTESIESIRAICENYLKDMFELKIIDIYQQPDKIRDDQIFAAPTLVKRLPPPFKKLIGDLTDEEKVLVGLGLKKKM